jgi:hypothetical protein
VPLISLSLKHEKPLQAAQRDLESVVQQVQSLFGMMIRRIMWSPDRREVRLDGIGFWMEMSVDEVLFHVSGDMPLLGHLLGSRVSTGVQQIVQKTFQKQLR